MRGFSCIGLVSPRDPRNVGAVLRAAHNYRVAQVNIEGAKPKALRSATNTPMAQRHTPVFLVADVLAYLPEDTKIVAVDLVEDAVSLVDFCHPPRALYLFGPESGTLTGRHLAAAQHRVSVPTRDCMNLAATVCVVLYDRLAKGGAA